MFAKKWLALYCWLYPLIKIQMKYILLLAFFLPSCQSSKNTNTIESASFEQVVREKFEGDVSLDYNSIKSHVICVDYQNLKQLPTYKAKKFMIYDVAKSVVVYEDNFIEGHVEWLTDNEIKIVKGLGKTSPEYPDGYITYIYNLDTGTRKEKSSSHKKQ